MKKNFVVVFLVCFNSIFPQAIKINVSNLTAPIAKLYSLSGEKLTFIDSLSSSQNDFIFQIHDEKGFHRIVFDKNKSLDFVFDNEDIEIKTDANNVLDSLKIIKSESNRIYYDFIKLNKDYKKSDELRDLLKNKNIIVEDSKAGQTWRRL